MQTKIDSATYKGFSIVFYEIKKGIYSVEGTRNNEHAFSITGFNDMNELEEKAFEIIDAIYKKSI